MLIRLGTATVICLRHVAHAQQQGIVPQFAHPLRATALRRIQLPYCTTGSVTMHLAHPVHTLNVHVSRKLSPERHTPQRQRTNTPVQNCNATEVYPWAIGCDGLSGGSLSLIHRGSIPAQVAMTRTPNVADHLPS